MEHYIEAHNVILPKRFLEDIKDRKMIKDLSTIVEPYATQDGNKFFNIEPDETFWISWGKDINHGEN
jgi:hypothetical protein